MPELTPIQSQVLAGLLAGGSIASRCSAFVYALKEARARHRAILYDASQDLAARAYETLATLLASDNEQTRLRAAQAILRNTSALANSQTAEAVNEHLSSGGDRMDNAFQRRDAIRRIAPQHHAILESTLPAPPADEPAAPARQFDSVRQNSTLLQSPAPDVDHQHAASAAG